MIYINNIKTGDVINTFDEICTADPDTAWNILMAGLKAAHESHEGGFAFESDAVSGSLFIDGFGDSPLDGLLDGLQMMAEHTSYEFMRGCDWTGLDTYGGEEPSTTAEVWSWDETRVLVGCGGPEGWMLETREEFEG